jgi:hypothetical protein
MAATAEEQAVHRLAGSDDAITRQLAACSDHVVRALDTVAAGAGEANIVRSMRRSVSRLQTTSQKLAALQPSGDEPVFTEERALVDRDSHNGALTIAMISTAGGTLAGAGFQTTLPEAALAYGGIAALGLASAALLVTRRRRPSRRLATSIICVLTPSVIGASFVTTLAWKHAAYTAAVPSVGTNLLLAALPVVLPRPRWLLLILEAVLFATSFATYYVLDLSSMLDRISFEHPWDVLDYAVIGIQVFMQSEHRRVTSLKLLRAEANLRALARHTMLLAALKDRVSTPLQVLTLGVTDLERRGLIDPVRAAELETELDQIRIQWSGVDEAVQLVAPPLAFDADKALQPS